MSTAGAGVPITKTRSNLRYRNDSHQERESQSGGHATGHRGTNREIWGTWNKPYDFTLTVVGYLMGLHNLWRFPYLCYKFGGAFFLPFAIVLILVGIPAVFMEFTIGQYFSVGPTEACGQMAPILTGVSYLLAWNSMSTCLICVMMTSWARFYASDASTCLRGWESCNQNHHYNTEDCYTGEEDTKCNDRDIVNSSVHTNTHVDYIYYNYTCVTASSYCAIFGATYVASTKTCNFTPPSTRRKNFSIYKSRTNAQTEHFFGRVSGMIRRRVVMRKQGKYDPTNPKDVADGSVYVVDAKSSSGSNLKLYAFTSWLLIAIFLYEGLLSVTGITYVLNIFPFIFLLGFTNKALSLPQSVAGIAELVYHRVFMEDVRGVDIWAEAVIQVIGSTGVGNGVLITLSTFNRYKHKYLFDIFFATFLNVLTSACASLICFCTIGHYIYSNRINVPFQDYIHTESINSSIEFGFILYTHFLALIHDQRYSILIFFFMITSFATDSALRLVQMALDTLVAIFPGFRRKRLSALLGICALGFFSLVPMTQNGGLVVFMFFEYFTMNFVTPFIVLVQIAGFAWVYKASEIVDRAQDMKIISSQLFRWYIIICLKFIAPLLLIFVLVVKTSKHTTVRFNDVPSKFKHELFGWIFTGVPVLIFLGSVVEQFIKSKGKWKSLFHSLKKQGKTITRHSGLTATQHGSMSMEKEGNGGQSNNNVAYSPELVKAVQTWRQMKVDNRTSRFPIKKLANAAQHSTPNKTTTSWLKKSRRHLYTTRTIGNQLTVSNSRIIRAKASSTSYRRYALKVHHKSGESRSSFVKASIPEEDVIVTDTREEKWKVFLLKILSYFEGWPERFDEETEEEESDFETEESP